jgi:hypothetical protein
MRALSACRCASEALATLALLNRLIFIPKRRPTMNGKTFLAAVGLSALISASSAFAQGRSGGTPGAGMGQGGTVSSATRSGGMGAGMGAGPSSPNGVGAGSLLTGIDRAADATSGNANASAGFTSAMDLRAAAQTRRTTARANAQAAAKAAEIAKQKANENSAVRDDDE